MPARLGRYAVRRRIGSGGFATVWLAYDEQLDSPVAVKVLAENWTEDTTVRQRFLEEGRFLRKVESPYVVSVYDAGELEDGRPYLVMSYADQGTLADRLEVEGLTPAQAIEVVRQVGAGLQALHERGVLHRDVKPANVLFRTVDDGGDGTVRAMVADLGLGKALDVSSRLTMIAGTPSYVAPEQAQGEPLDPRADQYSLAALAYLLLAGRPPYAHASLSAAASPSAPPPLSTPERPFPAEVEAVVRRGLAVGREDRWPDVGAFVAALDGALAPVLADGAAAPWLPADPELTRPGARPSARPSHDPPPDPPPDPVPPRRTRTRLVVGGLVGVVALAVGLVGGYLVEQQGTADATVGDDTGSLFVTVPADWEGAVASAGWTAPTRDGGHYPALSVGTSTGWTDVGSEAEGVFVGILPGTELPDRMPQHPECDTAEDPVDGTFEDRDARTVLYTGCPGGVAVERVVQLASNRLLWVQIRSADSATANAVLDDVETRGI